MHIDAHEEEQHMAGETLIPDQSSDIVQSIPGHNEWNRGDEPENWWDEMLRYHGHVGAWNVLGWRIGRAALREFGAQWGDHTLDIVCHLPLQTPYTCIADGLMVGTGNTMGRLDLRLAEEPTSRTLRVSIRRKDAKGEILIFEPNAGFMQHITNRPVEELANLSRECGDLDEGELFIIRHR